MLSWGAAALLALLCWRGRPADPPPDVAYPASWLHLSVWAWAGVSVVLAAPLGLAHRRPLPVLALVLAESLAATVLGPWPWLFLLMTADALVCYVAATLPRPAAGTARRSRADLAAAAGTLAAELGSWLIMNHGWEQSRILVFALMASGTVIAWLAGTSVRLAGNLVRQRRDYTKSLHEQAAAQALTAERLRIARELHDMVAHSIGVIAIQAGAASLVIDTQPAGARKALEAIESTSRETLAGLRRMLVSLRQAGQDPVDAAPAVGLEAVDRLAETTAGAGLRLDVHWLGTRRPLPPELDLAAFRIIQESVTNAVRHSGGRHCRVSVEYLDEELAIEITDDGHGGARTAPAAGTGYGIAGMRERVGLLNGRFSAGSRPEGGFRVAARLPL